MSSRSTIIVLHLAGQYPLGGLAWQALHYVVGLTRAGHDVFYVEDSGAPPYDPRIMSVVEDPSYSVEFVRRMMERFDLGHRWAYYDVARSVCYGLSAGRLRALYGEADAIINLCGATRLREEHLRCPIRVYVETDPVYEQIKLAEGDRDTLAFLEAHTHHFTYGENLGAPDCPIPLEKFVWKPTRPPVILDLWPPTPAPPGAPFTSVATWKNVAKDITFRGERYTWSKHANFLRFEDLPRRSPRHRFELALGGAGAARLQAKGWVLVDAYAVSQDLERYRDYVGRSRGEFTVAKDLVARSRSGWFSDRSVCYLAAGKPVITQDTAFSAHIPTGRGLFAFTALDEAVAAVEAIGADYDHHCRAAREIAAECFDAEMILRRLVQEAGIS